MIKIPCEVAISPNDRLYTHRFSTLKLWIMCYEVDIISWTPMVCRLRMYESLLLGQSDLTTIGLSKSRRNIMSKNHKAILLIVMICQSWTESFPIYGKLFDSMVSLTANDGNTAHLATIGSYFISVVVFSFFINMKNVKQFINIGITASLVLSSVMWVFPFAQAFYISYALLGISTALISIFVCYIIVYGFNHDVRLKATAMYLFGWYFMKLILSQLMPLLPPYMMLILLNALLLSVVYLSSVLQIEGMVSPSTISEKPYPYKLLYLLAFVILLLYLSDSLIVSIVEKSPSPYNEALFTEWLAPLVSLSIYLIFYFTAKKINYFLLLFAPLILVSIGYILHIVDDGKSYIAIAIIHLSSSFINLFIFSFIGYLSLKFGSTFHVFRMVLATVALGSILGNALGRILLGMMQDHFNLTYIIPLFVLLISFLIMPWLAKYMNDETKTDHDESSGISVKLERHSEIIASHSGIKEKLVFANSLLYEGNRLTPREMEIAELLLERYDNETISQKLSISINTNKVHISRIYQKFQVSKKKELIDKVDTMWKEKLR